MLGSVSGTGSKCQRARPPGEMVKQTGSVSRALCDVGTLEALLEEVVLALGFKV